MEKSILATNIEDILIKHQAFIETHKDWFKRAIKKTKDNSLEKWIGREDYFIGVDEAMKMIIPNASKKERISKARRWYQKDVLNYIKSHPEVVKKEIAKKLTLLKEKYILILLTSNTQDYINKIIKNSKLNGIYDGIIASKIEEEPDKNKLIKELINRYGKPKYYLTGKIDDKINNYFNELGIKCIGINDINQL